MRMNTNDANIKSLILLLVISYLLLVISPVSAAEPSIWTGIESCREKGDCALNDFLILGINVSKIILRYAGAFAVLFFIVGGAMWMTSGGAQQRIETGKKIITGALTGMFIILFSYVLVNTVLTGLVGKKKAEEILKKEAVQQEMVCPVPPTNEKPWRNIAGCQNEEIKKYQARLNTLNCLCGTEDGIFGPTTESCTRKFQDKNGLTPDGLVGPETYQVYQKASPNPCEGG